MSVLILNQSGRLSECNRFKARFFLLVPTVTFRKVEKEDFFLLYFIYRLKKKSRKSTKKFWPKYTNNYDESISQLLEMKNSKRRV